ncbi:MAG: VanZ family protein [Ruminococcaceae bacterium]|nr:VanZ family protein [Oscillospiraceae bacterium]
MNVTPIMKKSPEWPLWRLIACIMLGLAILGNMLLIFGFSAESGEESGDRSHEITEGIVQVVVPSYPSMSPIEQEVTVEKFHLPIRKIAHFCEFGLLGLLTAAFMNTLGKGKKWLWWVIPAAFCLLYAISDEVHQMFTERGPAVKDVLIDFTGSVTGIIVMNLILLQIYRNMQKRKAKRVCESQDMR